MGYALTLATLVSFDAFIFPAVPSVAHFDA
jgi:hypothetical protein